MKSFLPQWEELISQSFLSDKMKVPGRTAALYLILYSAGRFVMEFFRGDEIRGSVGALSTSQFIALFIFLAGILLFVYAPRAGRVSASPESKTVTDDSSTET